jgi:hypothetical protein
MLAPRYQESACGNSVEYATSVTCSIHAASASGVASAVASPRAVRYPMQSLIHSTCCSIDSAMLLSTEGDPGPVTMNRFGKPGVATPRYARGPAAQAEASVTPPAPRMSICRSAPEIASNPVANTSASSS